MNLYNIKKSQNASPEIQLNIISFATFEFFLLFLFSTYCNNKSSCLKTSNKKTPILLIHSFNRKKDMKEKITTTFWSFKLLFHNPMYAW